MQESSSSYVQGKVSTAHLSILNLEVNLGMLKLFSPQSKSRVPKSTFSISQSGMRMHSTRRLPYGFSKMFYQAKHRLFKAASEKLQYPHFGGSSRTGRYEVST